MQWGTRKKVKKGELADRAFCKAFCWSETFLEARCLVRSICEPLVRARGAHGKTATHMPKARPMKCQWRGASGGRALPREAALGQRASCPLRQRRDRTRLRIGGSRAGGRAGARPSRWRLCQWLSRLRPGPATNGKTIASPSASRRAVLRCAPRARTQGRAMAKCSAKRFQRRAGHRRGERKVCDNH